MCRTYRIAEPGAVTAVPTKREPRELFLMGKGHTEASFYQRKEILFLADGSHRSIIIL